MRARAAARCVRGNSKQTTQRRTSTGASARAGCARARARVSVACARARRKPHIHSPRHSAHRFTRPHGDRERRYKNSVRAGPSPRVVVVGRKSRPRAVDRAQTTRSPPSDDARATGAQSPPLRLARATRRPSCGSPATWLWEFSKTRSIILSLLTTGPNVCMLYDAVNYATVMCYDIIGVSCR